HSDRIAEALTCRTCSEGGIKAEKCRLRFLIISVVVFTDIPVGKLKLLPFCRFDERRMAFAKTDLQRINETLPDISTGLQAVDQTICLREIRELIVLGSLQFDRLALSIQPRKSLLKERD